MSKKIQSVLSVALILLCGLCLFTSCASQKLDFFTNIGDSLDPVAKLVRAMHGWIGNYGWTVVVFTVFLKVVMLPLDFWQRYASRKATLKNKKMQPLLAAIDKRYGANTQRSQEEKAKLYKKNGGSGMGGEDILKAACSKDTKWLPGKRLSSRENAASVQKWVDELHL